MLTFLYAAPIGRAKERGVRGASRLGSLTIGSGSSAPPVDTRHRERQLPASAVFTPFYATFRILRLLISISSLPPRDQQHAAADTDFAPTRRLTAAIFLRLSFSLPRRPITAFDPRPNRLVAQNGTPWHIKRPFELASSIVDRPKMNHNILTSLILCQRVPKRSPNCSPTRSDTSRQIFDVND